MTTANFFTESQAQFEQSQQELKKLWDDYQTQIASSQKKLINSWVESLPSATDPVNLSDSVEKTLTFQKELINSLLNAQQMSVQLAVATQKQFWNNYFQTTQKMAQSVPMTSVPATGVPIS